MWQHIESAVRWLGRSRRLAFPTLPKVADKSNTTVDVREEEGARHLVPYDEHLFERARMQWQFGDWPKLIDIKLDELKHHPDRAKVAMLVAAAHLQIGDSAGAKECFGLADTWGVNRKLVVQLLVSGVYNTLGRAATVAGSRDSAIGHFQKALATGTPGADIPPLAEMRAERQISQLQCAHSALASLSTSLPTTAQAQIAPVLPDYEAIYSKLFSATEYSNADHIQYHFVASEIFRRSLNKEFTLLDVGSGRGQLLRIVQGLFPSAQLTSADLRNFHQFDGVDFIACDLSKEQARTQLIAKGAYDVVACTDVLEHLDKSFVEPVVAMLAQLAPTCILAIANHSDIWLGQQLHTIQEPISFWVTLLEKYFELEVKNENSTATLFLFVARSKKFSHQVQPVPGNTPDV